jgi:hypothetical protein
MGNNESLNVSLEKYVVTNRRVNFCYVPNRGEAVENSRESETDFKSSWQSTSNNNCVKRTMEEAEL